MDFGDEYDDSENDDNKSNDDDNDDVIIIDDAERAQSKSTQQKTATAVEKGMTDNELIPYFNRYIRLMREQRQEKATFSEEQLHDFLTDVFNSLEYKNDESNGKIKEKFSLINIILLKLSI